MLLAACCLPLPGFLIYPVGSSEGWVISKFSGLARLAFVILNNVHGYVGRAGTSPRSVFPDPPLTASDGQVLLKWCLTQGISFLLRREFCRGLTRTTLELSCYPNSPRPTYQPSLHPLLGTPPSKTLCIQTGLSRINEKSSKVLSRLC